MLPLGRMMSTSASSASNAKDDAIASEPLGQAHREWEMLPVVGQFRKCGIPKDLVGRMGERLDL